MNSKPTPERLSGYLWAASAVLFVLMAVAAFFHSGGAWPLCVAGVTCMVFANLDRISAISASTSGINIALNRAEVSIAQMTRLIRMSSTLQMAVVQRSGRLGGFSALEKQKFLEESIALLRDAGITEAEIRDLRYEPWDRFVLFDYVLAAIGGSRVPHGSDGKPVGGAARKEWEDLRTVEPVASSKHVRDFLERYGALTDEGEEFLKDYDYYQEHRSHRRADYAERLKHGGFKEGLTLTKIA